MAGVLGWGLPSQFLPFSYFPNFSGLWKHTIAIEYHVYIWQVSPQLSRGDTCRIWMWFKESNRYISKIQIFVCREISERSFSNPHPWLQLSPGGHFTINMESLQYRKFHHGDEMVIRLSYLHSVNYYSGKMPSLYWKGSQAAVNSVLTH